MSGYTSTDRWTCPAPGCGHTEHLQVVTTLERARERLQRVRQDHARAHARGARTHPARARDSVTGGAR